MQTGAPNDLCQSCSPLQDPVSWGDVASFDMSEAATPPRHERAGYTSLLQEKTLDGSAGYATKTLAATVSAHEKGCAQFATGAAAASLTPVNAAKPTQGPAGRRRRKERGEPSPLCDRVGASFLENVSLNSPKKTPTKSLPFTPSRVSDLILFSSPNDYRLSFPIQHNCSGGVCSNMPSLSFIPVLQHIRGGASEPGQPGPHVDAHVWPEVPFQHAAPEGNHAQAPEGERHVSGNCH